MFKIIVFLVFCLFLHMGSFAWAACDGELSTVANGNTSCDSGDNATINSNVTLDRNANHTINTADNVTITTPNGGETFESGGTLNIQWDSNKKAYKTILNLLESHPEHDESMGKFEFDRISGNC